jgi:transposase InsO family protein
VPSRSAIYRCLVRHHLIGPVPRRRRREDYRRWERSSAMDLWQMDVMGGVRLQDGRELKIVTGIDDHSRFCVSAALTVQATARPVCEALAAPLRRYGAAREVLTDNGRVFTARFGPGPGPVLFDRTCSENGIRHLLTAPRSPTTTGKVERFHKTVRAEFLAGRSFASIAEAQAALDAWIGHYNGERPHHGHRHGCAGSTLHRGRAGASGRRSAGAARVERPCAPGGAKRRRESPGGRYGQDQLLRQ